ncbi:MAG: autotransporter-associated beta strand repeat-containing protein [Pseudomonadota bacterium]
MTETIERRPGRLLRHGLLLAGTALVAPLFITIASPAFAQQAGGQGGNASAGVNPGGGGNAGQSSNGIVIGTNGGNGSAGGGGILGGGGGISDWGGGGGRASGRAAGGGGGGAGGVGLVIDADGSTTISTGLSGASGGNGGHASSIGSGATGGRGGGGGGGGGGSGIYVTSPGTDATITVNANVTVQGGNGGAGGDGSSTNGSATSDGGRGGNGGHGITVNSMTEHVTINNSGTISGGVGGSGGYGTTGIRNGAGEKGSGIIGSNVTITNNATGTIKPGDGAVPVDYTNTGSVNNAITITGGTNSIRNAGSINGRIELGGLSTTTISGAYSNALKVTGGSTMKVEGSTAAGDATGFTTIQNGGMIDIAAGRKVSATGEIGNGPGGSMRIGANATLSGGGSNFYNNGTVDVAAGGTFSNAGSIDNYGGIINFSGAGAKMTAGNDAITNWGQINVTSGDVTVTGNFDNSNGGKISLSGGDMSGVSTLTNGMGGSVDVGAGRTLSVETFTSTAGSTTGSGTITAADAINLSSGTYATVFSGTGKLTKSGTGTVILTGENTYSGGTTIEAGTLQIGDGGTTGSITGDVTNDGTLAFNRSNELTFDGDISGSGRLTKSGAGTLILTGENSHAGGTTIDAGILQIGNGGTSGSITGNVANEGTLAFNRSDDIEFDGVITGSGGLVKDGGGKLTLTGANYFEGGTEIREGTLQVGDGGTSGQITGNVINDGTLIFNRSDDIGFGSEISGTGELVKDGAGVLTVWGDITHTGGTTIKAGTLQIGNGGVSGTLAGDVVNDGTLAFHRYDYTFEGDISGSGSLVQKGPGVLTLTGSATHTGGTTITAGTLRIGDGGTTGAISGGILNDSALVFDRSDEITYADEISGSGSVTQQGAGTLILTGENTYMGGTTISTGTLQIGNGGATGSITGDVDNDGTLAFNRSDDLDFAGIVFGTGKLVKKGGGTLTLTGANTYTGATKIEDGTLKLGSGGSLAETTDVDVAAGAVFDLDGHTQTVGAITGAGEIKLGADGDLMVNFASKDATFAGTISGGGSLVKTGLYSKLILTGDNTYTGGTTIEEGILQVGNGATGSISGDIVNNALLFFGRNDAMTYDGDISGTGEMRNYGTGVLTLTGTLSHLGGTEIAAGTLKVGNGGTTGSISGDIVNGSRLAFDRSDAITYEDEISGKGSLTQAGAGTLILTGANSYSGGTVIANGTLQIGNGGTTGSITGDVDNDGTLVFKRSDDIAFGGEISGAGKLVKAGANRLTLTGASSFTGGTTIKGGTLAIGDGGESGSLSGDVVNDGELVFNRSNAISFGGAISGSGGLTKLGADVLTLTGVNSYSGITTITDGTLKGAAQSFGTGRIDNESALIIDQATDASFANVIDGEGSFTKTGAGTLTLTGASGLTGATTVAAGTLSVAGSLLGSTVTVEDGATLSGTGRIGGLVVAGDGILATGNSIGTLVVEGDVLFEADSIFRVEVDDTGKTDKLEATGDVTIRGGTVDVRAGDGSYGRITSYTILTGRSVTGAFSEVTSNLAFLDASLFYGATSVTLELERNNISFGEVARTRNQRATADAAEKLGDGHAVFDAILDLDEDMARNAFDSLSGDVHASIRGMLLMDSHFTRDAALERLRTAFGGAVSDSVPVMALAALPDSGVSLWGTGFGSWGRTDSDGNAAGFTRTAGGFIAGADAAAGKHLRFGAFTGFTQSSFDASDRESKGDANSYHAGLYAGGTWEGFGLRAGASYGWSAIDTSRDIDFGGLGESLDADYNAGTAQVFGEAAYRFGTDGFALEPFAGLAYVSLDSDDVEEDGGAAALAIEGDTQALTFSTLGLRAEGGFAFDDLTLTLRGMGGWRHAEGDLTPVIDAAFGDQPGFGIAGAPVAEDTAIFEAGLDLGFGNSTRLGLSYMGEIGRDAEQHSGQASLAVDF